MSSKTEIAFEHNYFIFIMTLIKLMYEVTFSFKLLGKALYAIVTGTEVSGVTNSLLTRLVGVHVAYHYYQKEIMWLGQLISLIPGILVKLHAMEG